MKKEMKMLAIVPAAFALALCLASCEQWPSEDYSFKTLYINYEWYGQQYRNQCIEYMPKAPVYGKMSKAQLEKFNKEAKEFAMNRWSEDYTEDLFDNRDKAIIKDDGTFIAPIMEMKQDINGNWYFLEEGDL